MGVLSLTAEREKERLRCDALPITECSSCQEFFPAIQLRQRWTGTHDGGDTSKTAMEGRHDGEEVVSPR